MLAQPNNVHVHIVFLKTIGKFYVKWPNVEGLSGLMLKDLNYGKTLNLSRDSRVAVLNFSLTTMFVL